MDMPIEEMKHEQASSYNSNASQGNDVEDSLANEMEMAEKDDLDQLPTSNTDAELNELKTEKIIHSDEKVKGPEKE
jgi:hypothetical protein